MTSPLSPSDLSEDDDLLAAEYVLGVIDAELRAKVDYRLKRDAVFAAAVADWENRLGGLNDDFDEVPAPNLLPKIEARLFPQAETLTRKQRNWFGFAGGAMLAASLAVAVVVTNFPVQPPVAPLLTTLAAADLAYEVRADGETLQVTRVSGSAAPAGQVHELWVIAPGAAPVSLGLLAEGPLQVAYPVPPAGWTLAVSVEPAGGSTTGAPTGPVILAQELGT